MTNLHHIALGARKVEAVASFYRDVFELSELDRHTDGAGRLRSIWLGAGKLTLMIERTDDVGNRVEGVGAGPFLLAFEVDPGERAAWEERLNAAGAWIEERTEHSSYARDPEGHRVAISHHPEPPRAEIRERLRLEQFVEAICEPIEALEPATAVASAARRVAERAPGVTRHTIGEDETGRAIEAYEFGTGQTPLLAYGFPDPGEAVGGNALLALMRHHAAGGASNLTADFRFHVIPVLNAVDQPGEGDSLETTYKSLDRREVDWCLDHPRPETRALLEYADVVEPSATFPLHDEFHADDHEAGYVLTDRVVDAGIAGRMSAWIRRVVPIADAPVHETMGPGFAVMAEIADDWDQSTFSVLSEWGPVVIPEVPRRPTDVHGRLVAAQTGAWLIAAAELLSATHPR